MALPFPWPIDSMRQWYEQDQMTLQEIADKLCTAQWQPHWITHLGREYYPTQKIVNKVAKRHGFAMRPTGALGFRNGAWRGGKIVDKSGYILVHRPDHPRSTKAGYIRLHRLVAEAIVGRILRVEEVVHHIDDDPSNNDPSNLIVFANQAAHVSNTMKGKVPASRLSAARAILDQLMQDDPQRIIDKRNATRRKNQGRDDPKKQRKIAR